MLKKMILILVLLYSSNSISKDYDVSIIGSIGPFTGMFAIQELFNVDKNVVDIYINSGGGIVYFGEIIIDQINTLKQKGTIVNCYVQGMAASMAFTILQSCSNRLVFSDTRLMQHHMYYLDPYGNKVVMDEDTAGILRLNYELERINLDYRTYLKDFIEDERFFTPLEALSIGAIDEIIF